MCKLAKNRDDVDDRILNASDLIQGVWFGGFSMDLPPNTKTIDNGKEAKFGEEGERKKRKPNPKEDGKRHITNEGQHPDLKMKESEDWKKDFVGKHSKIKPFWESSGKVRMCVHWHVKGDCFKDCEHSASHVKADDIPEAKLTAMKKYIAKCRD